MKQRAEAERRQGMLDLADRFESSVGGVVNGVTTAATELQSTAQSMSATAEQTSRQSSAVATASDDVHIRLPLKALSAQLDPDIFWRVHRNAIVRVSAIRQVKPDEDGRLQVWLEGISEPIRVSDSFRHRFRAM